MQRDREKLIELIGKVEYGNGSLVGNNFQKGFIAKIADHLLANGVTVQKHGRWGNPIKVDPDNNGYKCSECGEFGAPCWNYCSNCGARMDGE